jgi:hypothetical protein
VMKQAEAANEPDPFSHGPRAKADRTLEDAMETWFSPFSTDESGWHGSNLGVPTPYPSSWTTDLINKNESY